MDPSVARRIAHYSHAGQRTRQGDLRTAHLERVAAAVPEEARTVAFLHDVLEHSDTDGDELLVHGLTPTEAAALSLLTRSPGESYELYVLRIAHAAGPEGRQARAVKLADVEDHMRAAPYAVGDPPYAWARQRLLAVGARRRAVLAAREAAAG